MPERCAEEFQPIVDALLYLPSCSKRKDHRVEIIHDPMGALNALGTQKEDSYKINCFFTNEEHKLPTKVSLCTFQIQSILVQIFKQDLNQEF